MDKRNIINVSGGKDSLATWLHSIERETENIFPVFADTGNEHQITYDYLDYLESKLGKIKRVQADFTDQVNHKREWIKKHWPKKGLPDWMIENAVNALVPTGNPFLDLCLSKGRFPSKMVRFCTVELKVKPIFEQVYMPLLEQNHTVWSWQGIRADESRARAKLTELEQHSENTDLWIYRPILAWTAADVFAIAKKHGIKPNPLYKQGAERVGCMPCINSRKNEILEIAKRYPEEIKRISEWEKIVSMSVRNQGATYFNGATRVEKLTFNDDGSLATGGIYAVIEWAKTSKGADNYDLFRMMPIEENSCSSVYGLCE